MTSNTGRIWSPELAIWLVAEATDLTTHSAARFLFVVDASPTDAFIADPEPRVDVADILFACPDCTLLAHHVARDRNRKEESSPEGRAALPWVLGLHDIAQANPVLGFSLVSLTAFHGTKFQILLA